MKENINQILKLFIVCVVAAAVLALVYAITKEPIEKSKQSETLEAIQIVVSGIMDQMIIKDTLIVMENDTNNIQVYMILNQDSSIFAYSIKAFTELGYGGKIAIMVGVDKEFNITGLYPLEFHETPGLGMKMTKDEFKNQFLGKSLDNYNFKVQKDGGDIVAITAATITSRAVGDALNRGLNALVFNFKKEVIDTGAVDTSKMEEVK